LRQLTNVLYREYTKSYLYNPFSKYNFQDILKDLFWFEKCYKNEHEIQNLKEVVDINSNFKYIGKHPN